LGNKGMKNGKKWMLRVRWMGKDKKE